MASELKIPLDIPDAKVLDTEITTDGKVVIQRGSDRDDEMWLLRTRDKV